MIGKNVEVLKKKMEKFLKEPLPEFSEYLLNDFFLQKLLEKILVDH